VKDQVEPNQSRIDLIDLDQRGNAHHNSPQLAVRQPPSGIALAFLARE
jgi:hypothetical protein